MFNFFQKQSKPDQATAQQDVNEQLPEGCELLSDCEFAEVSGGTLNQTVRPVNL